MRREDSQLDLGLMLEKTLGRQFARTSTACWSAGRAISTTGPARRLTARSTTICGHARAALPGRASPGLLARDQMLRGCDHLWGAWRSSATQTPTPRETTVVGLEMKPVGEPYAGNPHVRFDERGVETERWPHGPQATAPLLDSTPRDVAGIRRNPTEGASDSGW